MAIAFSLIMGGILAFAILLVTAFLWFHFAPESPDDMDGLLVGSLFGAAAGIALSATLLWKLWPQSVPSARSVPE